METLMYNWSWNDYRGNLKWLPERTIYLTVHGSHAYGTSLPTSDLDLRGVAIAPREYYHGFSQKFEQAVQNEPDLTIFELRKFLFLASQCNPNVIEILFTDPSEHLVLTELGEKLLANRNLFVTQRARHTFSGYAVSQLKRIRLHRRYLLSPPAKKPARADFGLPECTAIPREQLDSALAAISKRTDEWAWREMESLEPSLRQSTQDEFNRRLLEITQWSWEEVEDRTWESAARGLGFNSDFLEVVTKERSYRTASKEWQNYQTWKKTRNPARAKMEAEFGMDLKHALHLVRLLKMTREILTTGQVIVKRPDAEELLAIRRGEWSYDQLIEWAEKQEEELETLASKSNLRKKPDMVAIDQLCLELVEEALG
jgi:hypothetical protein